MCFNLLPRQMFNYSFLRYIVLYFICILCLSVLCHTVVNATDPVTSHQNESISQETKIENFKRKDKKQENVDAENKSRNINTFENKVLSTELTNNGTVHNKPLMVEDVVFNSTEGLSPWMVGLKEGALQRTGYVALGFMSVVLIFFIIRAVR